MQILLRMICLSSYYYLFNLTNLSMNKLRELFYIIAIKKNWSRKALKMRYKSICLDKKKLSDIENFPGRFS